MEKDLEISLDEKENFHDSARPPKADTKPPSEDRQNFQQLSTAQSNHISLSDVDPVDVQVRDLAVNVDLGASPLSLASLFSRKPNRDGNAKSETKQILHSVSASMPPGTLTAIIGGSGSGKTTMLNTMAERMTSGRLSFGGSTTFNGTEGVNNIRSAYVMQQDVLLPTLTVRETVRILGAKLLLRACLESSGF
jgi:ABC-type glutathione transport system ATPase component